MQSKKIKVFPDDIYDWRVGHRQLLISSCILSGSFTCALLLCTFFACRRAAHMSICLCMCDVYVCVRDEFSPDTCTVASLPHAACSLLVSK